MNPGEIMFYVFVFIALAGVIGIMLTRNVFKGALFLLMCLLSIAALYVMLSAEFVAITQILIYAGGIVVVLIFGIMLTTRISGKPLLVTNSNIFSGALVSIALLAVLINLIAYNPLSTTPKTAPIAGQENIGINFMTSHALPFEVAGVLLLVALIGAAVVTSFMKSKKI
jgi:NADH:ubiquinone oxidoreductase subunit 6 (subunit J)